MKPTFYCDTAHIFGGLARFQMVTEDKLKQACKETSVEMQEYAELHAPWRDRTGDARAGLRGTWGLNQYVYYIKLSHSVKYGVYLELGMEKRFEIIAPTMKKYANRPWELYAKMMKEQ